MSGDKQEAQVLEREAIARLKSGDIGGLQLLVVRYQAQALRTSFLICQDQEIAEDSVQAAFLQAYERIEQFDSTRPFGPWFLRSVINSTLQVIRRRRTISLDTMRSSMPDGPTGPDYSPELLFEVAETREVVWEAIMLLTPDQRATVVALYYLGLSAAEIAVTLEIPPGTVRRRLYDAHQRLRHLLPAWLLKPGE